MIAALMLYCLVISSLFACAAIAAEHLLRLARRPTRLVWMAATLGAIGFSAARFQVGLATPAPSSGALIAPAADSVDDAGQTIETRSIQRASTATSSVLDEARTMLSRLNAIRILITSGSTVTRLDEPLLVGWFVFSLAGLIIIGYAAVRLATPEPRWAATMVDGVPVLLSHDVGPAVIGLFRYRIVLPKWTLELPPVERDLVLVHEREHAAAGDPSLLFLATVLVALTPWNAPLWWMARRLRFAIELDCDARVLRSRPDKSAYGALLLDVTERTFAGAMPIVALAEPVSLIERRIAAMTSRVPRFVLLRAVAAGSLAAALIVVACAAPRPSSASPSLIAVAPKATGETRASVVVSPPPVVPTPNADTRPAVQRLANTQSRVKDTPRAPQPAESTTSSVAARVDTEPTPPPRPLPNPPADVESFFHRLFDGIALTPDQEAKARAVLTTLQQEQVAQSQTMLRAVSDIMPKRLAVQTQRDSTLRSLLTNDADKALFDARVAPPLRGNGGRSGGPPSDSSGTGRSGRGGGRGLDATGNGGRGGGRGGAIPDIVDATFHRMFDGIVLTPEQEGSARATLAKAQQDLQALSLPLLPLRLAMRPMQGTVLMQAESAAELGALLTNDADRATLQSRISVAGPPPAMPRP